MIRWVAHWVLRPAAVLRSLRRGLELHRDERDKLSPAVGYMLADVGVSPEDIEAFARDLVAPRRSMQPTPELVAELLEGVFDHVEQHTQILGRRNVMALVAAVAAAKVREGKKEQPGQRARGRG